MLAKPLLALAIAIVGNATLARAQARRTDSLLPPRFTSIAAGSAHFCALDTDGDIYCWGDNHWGQLGTGGTESSTLVPLRVASLQHFRQVVTGATHTCALTDGGYSYCWGSDNSGVMGDATLRETCGVLSCATRPTPVAIGFRFDSLTAGFEHTCGLTAGRVACWGRADDRQLGTSGHFATCDGIACSRTPLIVEGAEHVTSVIARGSHTCALASGDVRCWGGNDSGELGTNSRTSVAEPVASSTSKFTQIASAGMYTCGVTISGSIECWGANDQAQLGAENLRATRATIDAPRADAFVRVAVGGMHNCALTARGVVYCWGSDAGDRLGGAPTGTCNGTACSASPVRVTLPVALSDVAVGGSMACAVGVNGSVYCWGGAATGRAVVVTNQRRR